MLAALLFVAAGCGGGDKQSETDTEASPQALAACTGSALKAAPKLPPSFPMMEHTTFTRQRTEGPTNLVEGYWKGDLKEAHDEYKKGLDAAGYKTLFDELEDHDSEISWSGEGRTGQVALRDDCGGGKIYVHVTNRPA